MSTTLTTSSPAGASTTSAATTLVDHWSAELKIFTEREKQAKADKEKAATALDAAKDDLSNEEKLQTELTTQIADTRAALAKADLVEVDALSRQLFALVVRQHDSEGQRLVKARRLDEAQVEADVTADRVSDATAGLSDAKAKLAAASTAKQKRDELIAAEDQALMDAAARAGSGTTKAVRGKAEKRIEVVPATIRSAARTRFDAEVKDLETAEAAAKAAKDEAARDEGANGGLDAEVAARRRAFADAEDALRAWFDSAVADVTAAIATLSRIAGKDSDPPLLSDKEKQRIEAALAGATAASTTPAPPAAGAASSGEKSSYEEATPAGDATGAARTTAARDDGSTTYGGTSAPPPGTKPPAGPVTADNVIALGRTAFDRAREYHELVAKKKAEKPGADPDADPEVQKALQACDEAATAYAKAVTAFAPRATDYVPDKVWQALLDVWIAQRSLDRVKDPVALKKALTAAESALVKALGQAADHRRKAEDLKYEARRRAKLLESVRADYPARLFARVRGDF